MNTLVPRPAGPFPLIRDVPRADGPVPLRLLTPNATLTERHDLTADMARFVVRPDEGAPDFEPGQYMSLGLEIGGKTILRPYSTASPSGATETLEFLIKRVDSGSFTPSMWGLAVGGRLWMGPPKGLFTLTSNDSRTHLLVSAGTGIAPFISMLSRLSRTSIRVVVAHGVSYEPELAYRPWLESLAATRSNVLYAPTVSRPDAPQNAAWGGRSGRVEQVLAAICADVDVDPAATVAYLCGNPDMVERSREVLRGLGMAEADIVRENYWAPTAKRAACRRSAACAAGHESTRPAEIRRAFCAVASASYLARSAAPSRAAWAAARRATGTRNGEQDT